MNHITITWVYMRASLALATVFLAVGVQAADNSMRIAVSVLDEEHGGIYVLNADGSGKQRLTKGSSDILPRWSPDGKQIAFLATREQDHELAAEHDLAFHWFLYVMDADGQNQRRVTKTPIGMIFQWSPDGTRFVFQSSYEDGNNKANDGTVSSAIYVMKSDGTQQKRLTPVNNNDAYPSWSPDGKQIAFCSKRHGNRDVFVMNADGSDARRLTSNEANDIGPTWSPDGKQIAFASSRKSGNAHVMNADGTQEFPLAVRGRPVAWSPDGQSLLLENDGQLVLSDADGRNQKELTKAGKPALDGEFSTDGNAVLYRSKVNGTWTLMSVDTERSSPKRIWSDSGKFLGFSVKDQLQGVDLTGVKQLTLSPDGKLAAGFTKLYSNPGSRSGSFSLFKIWSVQEQELLHQIRVPAEAYEVVFSPDSSTVITAEKKGNLGNDTTFRAWDRAEGKERKLGTSVGKIFKHCFSPDGRQWATLTLLSEWDHPSSIVQINVWPVAGKGKPVRIDISHPLGWVEFRPPVTSALEDKLWQVVPMHVRFSPDGKQLVCKAGLRTIYTIYDARTGKLLEHANVSSVGMLESMLMIAMHQAPDDAKSLTLDVTPSEMSMEFQRAADGWWRVGKSGKIAFKVDGEHFTSLIKGVEKKEHIMMGLGLKDGTKLGKLSSFKHPLGVVMINRDEAGLTFRLEEVKDGTEPGEIIQAGNVRWGPSLRDQ